MVPPLARTLTAPLPFPLQLKLTPLAVADIESGSLTVTSAITVHPLLSLTVTS
jgi:hypothetical protein